MHNPLFFLEVVEIERFALRAGILDDLIRERGKVLSPEPRPLGTYEIKIAVCTGKPSILTILRNLGDCQQSGGGGVRVLLAKWRFLCSFSSLH